MRKYFGTDGIRRIANTELTPELVYKVAKSGAYVLSKHTDHVPTILIGRDFRRGGFPPPLSLLIPTFAFPDAPEYLTVRLRR